MRLEITRRGLLWLTALAGGAANARTPEQTPGPFYPPPDQRFADDDTDLVKIEGAVREAGGEILHLSGRILSDGRPVAGARVEIWQCDVTGQYIHAGDRGLGGGDRAFQGYGQMVTGAEGAYAFRTIKPASYPGRTPHIHVTVSPPEEPPLTTQLYVAGHPDNRRDFLFRRLSKAQQAELEMTLTEAEDGFRTERDVYL